VLAISRRARAIGARFLVLAGLAVTALLVTMPGAQAAPSGESAYSRNAPASQVMPRGGEGQPEAPAKRDFDWTPLVILGGLLGTSVGAYLLYSVRHPA
jgi:hypothetical protein